MYFSFLSSFIPSEFILGLEEKGEEEGNENGYRRKEKVRKII